MTICSPIITSKGLFWNIYEGYQHSSFVLQHYSGPIWWNDKFRIILLIEQSNSGGYLIASSSNREDIISNWNIILSIFQDKVEKTGLSQFSETFLLNIYKKLYKKLYKLSVLEINKLSTSNHNHKNNHLVHSNNRISGSFQQSLPQQHYNNQQQQPQQQQDFTKVHSPSKIRESLSDSKLGIIPLNNIMLGKQRRVGLLFKELYQADPNQSVDKLLSSIAKILPPGPDNEWVEWHEENTGIRPIHVSVQRMNIGLIKFLIDQKVDVNIKDVQGWSPLHFSAFAGNLEICQLLIEQGNAAVMTISKDGTLPLHYLAKHSFQDKTNQISNKFLQILELLLQKGTPIDAKTIRGESALHRACFMGSIQVATYLIDKKANIDIQNVRGETPLYYAVIGGHKQIAKLLIENGADSEIGGATGNAIDAARNTNQKDLLCFLASFEKSHSSKDIYLDDQEDQDGDNNQNNNNNSNSNNNESESLVTSNDSNMEKPFYPHVFIFNDFKNPTWCSYCSYYMWGLRRQGFTCEICGYSVHSKCKKKATLTESCDLSHNHNIKLDSSNSNSNSNNNNNNTNGSEIESHNNGIPESGTLSSSNSSLSSSISVDEYLTQTQDNLEPQPLHKKKINRKRLESLYNHFNALDKDQTGVIFKKEFGQSLGSILNDSNTILNALFTAFDSNGDGKMDLRDFLNGVSILQNSSFNSQLKFAFKMLDKNNNGYLTIGEFCSILESMHASLENLKIKTIQPIQFIKSIFPKELYQLKPQEILYSNPGKNNRCKLASSTTHIGLHRDKISPPTSNSASPQTLSPLRQPLAYRNADDINNNNRKWINTSKQVSNQSISLPNLPTLNNILQDMSLNSNSNSTSSLLSVKNNNSSILDQEINFSAKILFKDYKRAIVKNKLFIQSLGLVSEDCTMENSESDVIQRNNKQQNNNISQSLKWINIEGKEITLGHENWETMQCIMIGIRRAIGESITLPTRALKPKDFDVISEFKYNGWLFRDFAPLPFKRIRDKLEIDTKFFMFTLGPEKIFGNLLLGNLSVLCEVMSSGRSGSMFFRSNEGRYLIKTIPPNEETVLKTILPTYVQHIYKYPNTLLTRVLGCYNIVLKSKDLKFIVMNNLFYTPLPIHEKYDLKGSTIGRHVELPPGSDSSSNELKIAEIALKDLDFKRKLNIGPTLKAPLLEQIEHDTKFLESHNICDYSLLVGVHRIDEHSPLALSVENGGLIGSYDKDEFDLLDEGFFKKISGKTSLFQQYYGGILSLDKREVYFISIIDTFTTWDFRKKYENMLKSIVHDSTQISAINPFSYRKRFQKLISTIVE
ncbi:ankyrin repeat-containing protein [Tieghemostelium lacteum]|uniref:Ankyrin repeat-containing protein n=1 Tax=Tieghemostelium lacteum TaxID=361077 RepID=A0A151Z3N3_TIELA|nr:ankyrin repeat-containing protein [Tieghemostelium lacteum]|eukprot:KYQ88527.1 ankyrin repeat-containing protein [Tieghemostelium lacteum]